MKWLCIAAAFVLLLTGCSSAGDDSILIPNDGASASPVQSETPATETPAASAEATAHYDENTILYTVNLLKMGTIEDNKPFSYREEDGYLDGVDLAVAKQIAIDLGKEIKITAMAKDELIPALLSGEIHMALASLTAEQVDGIAYSTPYIENDGKAYCIAFKAGDEPFVKAVNDIIKSLIEYDDMLHIWANYTGESYDGGDQ